jgi:multidrug efflux pump subunit AcrA (membrane-fusion protein)
MERFQRMTAMLPLVAIISIVGCGSTIGTSTADLTVASRAYLSASNTLLVADQRLIDQQNADAVGSPELPTAIYDRLVLRLAFDKTVTAIASASDAKVAANIRAVLAANRAAETALEDLLGNTNILSDYNATSSLLEAAIGHFSRASAVVFADFGLPVATRSP